MRRSTPRRDYPSCQRGRPFKTISAPMRPGQQYSLPMSASNAHTLRSEPSYLRIFRDLQRLFWQEAEETQKSNDGDWCEAPTVSRRTHLTPQRRPKASDPHTPPQDTPSAPAPSPQTLAIPPAASLLSQRWIRQEAHCAKRDSVPAQSRRIPNYGNSALGACWSGLW